MRGLAAPPLHFDELHGLLLIQMTEHKLLDLRALAHAKDGTGHSIFSPSGASMWLACSGSLIPNILMPDTAGVDAAYGTVAHSVTEEWLKVGRPPEHRLGEVVQVDAHEITIDEEMFEYAEQCVDRSEWMPGDQLIEHRVYHSHLTPIPNQGGTLDVASMLPGRATLDDHKFGSSPENIVYAEENPQLMIYAIGLDRAFPDYWFEDFVLRINQPRLKHFDEWHTTHKRLMEFGAYVKERAAAAWQLDAPRTPGPKQCRFCAVRATCPANARLQEELLDGVFTDESYSTQEMQAFVRRMDDDLEPFRLHFKSAVEMSTAHLARLVQFRHMGEAWWKSIAAELWRRGRDGEKIPGHKWVEGRSRRHWVSQDDAKSSLIALGLSEKEVSKEVVVSPNQATDLLRKKGRRGKDIPSLLQGLVRKPPGKATLVPSTDKRPEVTDLSSFAFEDESENPESEEY